MVSTYALPIMHEAFLTACHSISVPLWEVSTLPVITHACHRTAADSLHMHSSAYSKSAASFHGCGVLKTAAKSECTEAGADEGGTGWCCQHNLPMLTWGD